MVWAVIFFFLMSSKIRPAEPIMKCGFSFNFLICLSMFAPPIIVVEVTGSPELAANNFTWASICMTNSCVGAKINTCISRLVTSIF